MRKEIAGLCLAGALTSQTMAKPAAEFRLWEGPAPEARGQAQQDIPTLTPFFADATNATGAAVVICPGGGYGGLAPHEGKDYARWLNELGIHAFVLKYRLGSSGYRHPAMMHDVQRAIRVVRANAADWGITPSKIGVMGSSAGGHLASTACTHFTTGTQDASDPVERVSCRPDFGILCYAVITMGEFTHAGSRENLLGKNPAPELLLLLSNEKQVTKDTPPCFIWHTAEDAAVDVRNSLDFAAALRAHGVPFALHVYPHGGHGMGLGSGTWNPAARHPWTAACAQWLQEQKLAGTVPPK